jgi:hypothetical protein
MEIHGGGGHQSLANLVAKGGRGSGNQNNARGGRGGGGRGGFSCGGKVVAVAAVHKEEASRLASSTSCAERRGTPSSSASKGLTPPFQGLRRSQLHQQLPLMG